MLRTINTVEKNLVPERANIIAVGAADTVVLKDRTQSNSGLVDSALDCAYEFAYILIQNVGANNVYYAFGQTCDPTNSASGYHGILAPLSTLPVSSTCAVHCYSTGNSSVAITIFKRIGL